VAFITPIIGYSLIISLAVFLFINSSGSFLASSFFLSLPPLPPPSAPSAPSPPNFFGTAGG